MAQVITPQRKDSSGTFNLLAAGLNAYASHNKSSDPTKPPTDPEPNPSTFDQGLTLTDTQSPLPDGQSYATNQSDAMTRMLQQKRQMQLGIA